MYLNYQHQLITPNNPYPTDDLHPETIKQLHDKHYEIMVLSYVPDELMQKEKDVYVFFTPICPQCKIVTQS